MPRFLKCASTKPYIASKSLALEYPGALPRLRRRSASCALREIAP
jgi:hypothetical protein